MREVQKVLLQTKVHIQAKVQTEYDGETHWASVSLREITTRENWGSKHIFEIYEICLPFPGKTHKEDKDPLGTGETVFEAVEHALRLNSQIFNPRAK